MKIPRPDQESIDLFRSLVPQDERIKIRPMFGNLSAFVDGNMFFGLFGNDLFVRLSSEDRTELLREKGASILEPMKGRPMKEYVLIPKAWRNHPETVESWISKSLAWTGARPHKKTRK